VRKNFVLGSPLVRCDLNHPCFLTPTYAVKNRFRYPCKKLRWLVRVGMFSKKQVLVDKHIRCIKFASPEGHVPLVPPLPTPKFTLLVFERYAIILAFSKPRVIISLSKKGERIAKSAFPQRKQVSLSTFSSHYMLNAKEGICEYSLVIYR